MTDVKAAEPSIEEILASIRKIISDDDEPAAEGAPAVAKAPEPVEEEVLELTDIVVEEAPVLAAPQPEPPAPTPPPPPEPAGTSMDTAWDEALSEQTAAPKIEEAPMPADDPADETDRIVSDNTFAAAAGALARLAQPPGHSSGGRSIEDITRDLLRPMLKTWLDQNLPGLVEKLVERELKKISRKAEDI